MEEEDQVTRKAHWKKVFQVRYEIEMSIATVVETYKICDSYHNGDMSALRDCGFGSFSKRQSYLMTREQLTECSISDNIYTSQKLVDQHGIHAHCSHQQVDNKVKEFCYLPYFTDHGIEKTLRRQDHQVDCSLCQKWLGGAKKDDEITQTIVDPPNPDWKAKEKGVNKKKGSKIKSMAKRACELCCKVLSNRKGLERHMLIHTGEKPFPCDVCGKPFRRKDNCVRHTKTAHLFKKPRKPRRRRGNGSSAL